MYYKISLINLSYCDNDKKRKKNVKQYRTKYNAKFYTCVYLY